MKSWKAGYETRGRAGFKQQRSSQVPCCRRSAAYWGYRACTRHQRASHTLLQALCCTLGVLGLQTASAHKLYPCLQTLCCRLGGALLIL